MDEVRRYAGTGISDAELRSEIERLWAELQTDSKLRHQAQDAKIDLGAICELRALEAIQIKTEAMGLDPATIAIIVSFSPVAAKVARDLWDYVLLPRIRRDKGADALPPAASTKV